MTKTMMITSIDCSNATISPIVQFFMTDSDNDYNDDDDDNGSPSHFF